MIIRRGIGLDRLDQGAVIMGIRSEKYPSIPCYGVIITASCDIANEKVAKLYYLVGVKAHRWFYTDYGFRVAYESEKNNTLKQFNEKCQALSLDSKTLLMFSEKEVETVINAQVQKPKDRDILEKLYAQCRLYIKPDMDNADRKTIIQNNGSPVIQFLKDIQAGRKFHYFYLPESKYIDNNKRMDAGIIVDLQEIGAITLSDAKKIITPGIDNLILGKESLAERKRLKRVFCLDNPDDFVGIEGNISSPWREHLMQRFSHDFSRIGIDGATDADYKRIAECI